MYSNNVFNEFITCFNSSVQMANYKQAIQSLLCTLQNDTKKSERTQCDEQYELKSIQAANIETCVSQLLHVIDENYDPEIVILASTCAAFIFARVAYDDVQHALKLYFRIRSNLKRRQFCFKLEEENGSLDNDSNLYYTPVSGEFVDCAFYCGLLNCRKLSEHFVRNYSDEFIELHTLCVSLCNQRLIHRFHCFRLFENWFRTFKIFIECLSVKHAMLFDVNSRIMRSSLSVINTNWENPVNGITDCTKSLYKLLLTAYSDYCKCEQGLVFDEFIVEEAKWTLKLSWTAKAKYRRISILVPYLGFHRFLELDSSIPVMLFKHLSINSLSSSITEAYKMILKSLLNVDFALQTWINHFLMHVCDAICSLNAVVYNNTVAHILPFTVNQIPESIHVIYERIGDKSEARILLLKVAHSKRIELSGLNDNCIHDLLRDGNDKVRLESFAFILHEKSLPRNVYEAYIFDYLKLNLNIDSPVFRQKMAAIIEKFTQLNLMRNKNKKRIDESNEFQVFALKYVHFLSDNIIPCTSFQRKTTSLLLLQSLFRTYTKLALPNDINQLLRRRLLLCIIDRDDTIRKLCSQLLITICKQCPDIEIVMQIALNLIHSPKHQESHSGALILRYIVNRFVPFELNGHKFSNELDILIYIFNLAKQHFEYIECNDLLNASFNYPLHGCILAINCVLSNDVIMKSNNDLLSKFMKDCKLFLKRIFDAMLEWLSSSISSKSSPSFQEMSVTLQKLIADEVGERDSTLLTTEFQCLLSYYWLNVKECSMLCSRMVQLQDEYKLMLMSDQDILEIGRYLVEVLLRCRHKGAIEACAIALTDYSKSAINLRVKFGTELNATKLLLHEVLCTLNTRSVLSNVTRRSAGIALIIQSILTGEVLYVNENSGNIKKEDIGLFDIAMDNLLSIVENNYNHKVESNTDHPLSLAMHIIKTIISTNLLSNYSSIYLEKLIKLCIDGLASHEWVIRNASLQLFGGCCLRILGQTKAAEDYSSSSFPCTLTCAELFLKFPSLVSIIEDCLNTGTQLKHSNSLIPILNLLSSLSVCGLDATVSTKISLSLQKLLSNPIWKVRSLAAKSLLSVVNIDELESILKRMLDKECITSNACHGIMLTVHNVFTARSMLKMEDMYLCETFKSSIRRMLNDNKVLQTQFRVLFEDEVSNCEIVENGCNVEQLFAPFDGLDIKRWLRTVYDNCDPLNTEDYRLFASQVLLKNLDAIKSSLNASRDQGERFLFYDILLRLLEDEDNDIRCSATKVVKQFLNMSFNPSFNVCRHMIIEQFLSIRASSEVITHLWINLETADSLIKLHSTLTMQQESVIIFEEEDKNVFAERMQYLIACQTQLDYILSTNHCNICLGRSSLNRIKDELQFILKNSFTIETVMKYSTNRLPKLYQSLISFILRLQIALKYSNNNFNCDELNAVQQLKRSLLLIGLQI